MTLRVLCAQPEEKTVSEFATTENRPAIAPLPVAAHTVNLTRGLACRSHQTKSVANSAALIPLFYAASLFLAGIVIARFTYLRPSFLLAGLLPLAVVSFVAIAKAPRMTWLAIVCIWLTLGIWSAEMEPAPAPDPLITQLSDGLLRTVEGTVTSSGPLRPRDAGDEAIEDHEPETTNDIHGEQIQRVDLQLTSVEVATDASDAMFPMHDKSSAKLRLSVL